MLPSLGRGWRISASILGVHRWLDCGKNISAITIWFHHDFYRNGCPKYGNDNVLDKFLARTTNCWSNNDYSNCRFYNDACSIVVYLLNQKVQAVVVSFSKKCRRRRFLTFYYNSRANKKKVAKLEEDSSVVPSEGNPSAP